MVIDRRDAGERQVRVDGMIAEFRAARQRRRVKQGIALWNRTEEALRHASRAEPPLTKRQ